MALVRSAVHLPIPTTAYHLASQPRVTCYAAAMETKEDLPRLD